MRYIAVIDIGKTNAKLALVDLERREEVAVRTHPNLVQPGPPWPHFDTSALWSFVRQGLADFGSSHAIDGISVTTHGAAAAMLDRVGKLAAPVLDYEYDGPDAMRSAYEVLRPGFERTGSPSLPMGLNLGAQLHWMLAQDPGLANRLAHVVTWPQYWGYLLTGELACDLCSLGCHTDLWEPNAGRWSNLPARLGLAEKMAPPRRPDEVLDMLRPALQSELGLPPLPVLVGIHDSNASLVPHLLARPLPFSVVSTGTWVIGMALGGARVTLDPQRDCLINVSALGGAVPSARFMGGREYDLLRGPDHSGAPAGPQDETEIIARGAMILPSVVTGSGPFPKRQVQWTSEPQSGAEREIMIGHYLGLMTACCLELIGAEGPVLVEGPFAAHPWFCRMLASATGRIVCPSTARTGTAVGAALLFADAGDRGTGDTVQGMGPDVAPDPSLYPLVRAWRDRVGG